MSIITLGDSINISTTNKIDISQKLTLDTGNNLTFSSGTILKIKNAVYLPDRNNIYIGNTSTTLSTLLGATVPAGCIIIWSGTVIPNGWASCDGTNGTPDLRDLFIIGTDPSHASTNTAYPLNQQGGNNNNQIPITINNLPPHQHTGSVPQAGDEHSHTFIRVEPNSGGITKGIFGKRRTGGERSFGTSDDDHSHTLTTNATGSTNPILDILPPYYALIYLMKL